MPDLDLLDLLSADHKNVLAAGPGEIVVEVSQHLSVERDFLYPEIRQYVEDGAGVLDRLRDADHLVEESLRTFDKGPSAQARSSLDKAIAAHVRLFERLLPTLRDQIPSSRLQELVESVPLSLGGSPTHPHPHLAEGGILGEVIEDAASVADHLRDALHPHHHPEEPDRG